MDFFVAILFAVAVLMLVIGAAKQQAEKEYAEKHGGAVKAEPEPEPDPVDRGQGNLIAAVALAFVAFIGPYNFWQVVSGQTDSIGQGMMAVSFISWGWIVSIFAGFFALVQFAKFFGKLSAGGDSSPEAQKKRDEVGQQAGENAGMYIAGTLLYLVWFGIVGGIAFLSSL